MSATKQPVTPERERQLVALRSASPMRPAQYGTTAPVDGLALFDHARQPALL